MREDLLSRQACVSPPPNHPAAQYDSVSHLPFAALLGAVLTVAAVLAGAAWDVTESRGLGDLLQ